MRTGQAVTSGKFSTNTVSGDTVIRTNGSNNMILQSETTYEALKIDTNNNIIAYNKLYVGTTTPSIYSTLKIDNTTGATSFKIKSTGTGSGYMFISLSRLYPTISTTGILNINGGLYVYGTTGYVGIGTGANSPAYPLDVVGIVHISNYLIVGSFIAASSSIASQDGGVIVIATPKIYRLFFATYRTT